VSAVANRACRDTLLWRSSPNAVHSINPAAVGAVSAVSGAEGVLGAATWDVKAAGQAAGTNKHTRGTGCLVASSQYTLALGLMAKHSKGLPGHCKQSLCVSDV
jgi:hypothetical protein